MKTKINTIAESVQKRSGQKTQFTFYLTVESVEALRAVAEQHGISMSALMDQLIRESVEPAKQ